MVDNEHDRKHPGKESSFLQTLKLDFAEPSRPSLTVGSSVGDGVEEPKPGALAVTEQMHAMQQRLERIEGMLHQLVEQRTIKEWYTTAELAQLLGKAEFTIREWCRLRRIHAEKRRCGRGRSQEWMVSHEELERIRNEGLLPQPTISTRIR